MTQLEVMRSALMEIRDGCEKAREVAQRALDSAAEIAARGFLSAAEFSPEHGAAVRDLIPGEPLKLEGMNPRPLMKLMIEAETPAELAEGLRSLADKFA
jgi:hypothetical protein